MSIGQLKDRYLSTFNKPLDASTRGFETLNDLLHALPTAVEVWKKKTLLGFNSMASAATHPSYSSIQKSTGRFPALQVTKVFFHSSSAALTDLKNGTGSSNSLFGMSRFWSQFRNATRSSVFVSISYCEDSEIGLECSQYVPFDNCQRKYY